MLSAEFRIRRGPFSRAPSRAGAGEGLTRGRRRGGSEALMAVCRAGPLVQESRTRARSGVMSGRVWQETEPCLRTTDWDWNDQAAGQDSDGNGAAWGGIPAGCKGTDGEGKRPPRGARKQLWELDGEAGSERNASPRWSRSGPDEVPGAAVRDMTEVARAEGWRRVRAA